MIRFYRNQRVGTGALILLFLQFLHLHEPKAESWVDIESYSPVSERSFTNIKVADIINTVFPTAHGADVFSYRTAWLRDSNQSLECHEKENRCAVECNWFGIWDPYAYDYIADDEARETLSKEFRRLHWCGTPMLQYSAECGRQYLPTEEQLKQRAVLLQNRFRHRNDETNPEWDTRVRDIEYDPEKLSPGTMLLSQ